jgi:hypothetical protein
MNIKNCKHCGSDDCDLYMEDFYHDITCHVCGCRTGKYGDENKALALWNGEEYQPTLYAVMWQGQLHGQLLELYDDKEEAIKRSKEFNNMIRNGQSVLGYKLDLTRGIRETASVQEIKLGKKYQIPELKKDG